MNPENTPSPDKWAAEKKAHAEGKTIQIRRPGIHGWHDLAFPCFDSPNLEYRIKPTPQDPALYASKAKKDFLLYQCPDAQLAGFLILSPDKAFVTIIYLGKATTLPTETFQSLLK